MWESLNTAILKDRAFSILCVGDAVTLSTQGTTDRYLQFNVVLKAWA